MKTRQVFVYSIGENIIEKLADYIIGSRHDSSCDFSRIACVFGGRRPGLFLLWTRQRVKKHYPPAVFTIDELWIYNLPKPLKDRG